MLRLLEAINGLVLVIMFLVTAFQIFARVVLGVSSVWSEELARFLFVWIVFLGAALLVRDEGHIRIMVLTDRLRGTPAKALRILTSLATIPFLVALTWGAWTNAVLNWNTFAPTLDWLRIGYVYLVVFFSGLLMLWHLALNLVSQARRGGTGPQSAP